ncbi:MAG TPA: hypothetical protein V6C86_24660 [Oculatellaceae cyanobacterium]
MKFIRRYYWFLLTVELLALAAQFGIGFAKDEAGSAKHHAGLLFFGSAVKKQLG